MASSRLASSRLASSSHLFGFLYSFIALFFNVERCKGVVKCTQGNSNLFACLLMVSLPKVSGASLKTAV